MHRRRKGGPPRAVLGRARGARHRGLRSNDKGGGGGGGGGGAQSRPGAGKPAITIGTKDFPEEFILRELYKQALERNGYTVNLRSNIGPTEVIDKALTSGKIDAYPQYTGETVAAVAGKNTLTGSAAKTTQIAKQVYAKARAGDQQPDAVRGR